MGASAVSFGTASATREILTSAEASASGRPLCVKAQFLALPYASFFSVAICDSSVFAIKRCSSRKSCIISSEATSPARVRALRRLPDAIFAALYAARPRSFFTLSKIIFVSCITC